MLSAAGSSRRVRIAAEGHRVTTFELFFDLVFVFAFTQVTSLLMHDHNAVGIVRAMVILGLIFWTWSAYAWLGNQAHADAGLMRAGLIVAMTAIFVVALALPEAWDDRPGGLDGPLVLALAYLVVRAAHIALYFVAAGDDPGLRRQLIINCLPTAVGVALVVTGALVGGSGQTALWAAALLGDCAGVGWTSRGGGGWRLHSVEHWTERHGLIVILALGESIVAIGSGAADRPVSWSMLGGVVFAILIATALWWLYFDVSADAARLSLARREGAVRVRAAIWSYTYVHYVVIAGIVTTAFGMEEAIAHTAGGETLDATTAGALCCGPAVYLAGLALFWLTLERKVKPARLVAAAALLLAWPLAAAVHPLAALAMVLAILGAAVVYETILYARHPSRHRRRPRLVVDVNRCSSAVRVSVA